MTASAHLVWGDRFMHQQLCEWIDQGPACLNTHCSHPQALANCSPSGTM